MTFDGDCQFRIIGSTQIPYKDEKDIVNWSVSETASGICTGCNFQNDPFAYFSDVRDPEWILGPGNEYGFGPRVMFRGCALGGLTAAKYAYADIRTSQCGYYRGDGGVDRSSFTTTFGPTSPGNNPYQFTVKYYSVRYHVSLQLRNSRGGLAAYPPVYVTNQTPNGFTIYDPHGYNTWDIAVILDELGSF